MCKDKYILVQWPDTQELMEYKDFEEHSSFADCDVFGPASYFVEEEWLNKVRDRVIESGEGTTNE